MRLSIFWVGAFAVLAAAAAATRLIDNEYVFVAVFGIAHLVMLATAWNVLGGNCGYINFGGAGFVAVGAYVGVAMGKGLGASLPLQLLAAGLASGLLGLTVGALSLRFKGIFFAIATLAVATILGVVVENWDFVGGARGLTVMRPAESDWFKTYNRQLFVVMIFLALLSIAAARYVQRSWLGRGMRALRDNEAAAEGCGVPTLNLKLTAATLSGALMGLSGTLLPQMSSFIEPTSLFALNTAVMALAMPMVGGTSRWTGPIIGALLLGTMQQAITVTVSSEANVLFAGIFLVLAVVVAPKGLLGLIDAAKARRRARSVTSGVPQQEAAQ